MLLQVSEHFWHSRDVYLEEGELLAPDEFNIKVSLSEVGYAIGARPIELVFTDPEWLPTPLPATTPSGDAGTGAASAGGGTPASSPPAVADGEPSASSSAPLTAPSSSSSSTSTTTTTDTQTEVPPPGAAVSNAGTSTVPASSSSDVGSATAVDDAASVGGMATQTESPAQDGGPAMVTGDAVILLPDGEVTAPPPAGSAASSPEVVAPKDPTAEVFEQFMTTPLRATTLVR